MGVGINQNAVDLLLLPSSLNQMGPIQYIRVLVSARTQHNRYGLSTEIANLRQILNLVINHVTSSNSKTNKGKSWQKNFSQADSPATFPPLQPHAPPPESNPCRMSQAPTRQSFEYCITYRGSATLDIDSEA